MGGDWSKITFPEPEACSYRHILQDISKDWYVFFSTCPRKESDGKFLLMSAKKDKTIIEFMLPEEIIALVTIKILSDDDTNKLVIVGSNNDGKTMHWERDLASQEEWSEPIELPEAKKYVRLENNRILALNRNFQIDKKV